jgi:hypothetical protein
MPEAVRDLRSADHQAYRKDARQIQAMGDESIGSSSESFPHAGD